MSHIEYVCTAKPQSFLELWRDVFHTRYLIQRLVWRDIKIRYNNTALGVLWNVIQPLALMLIFVVFLGLIFRNNTYGVPTAVYTYSALCVWQFFSRCLTQGGFALSSFGHIITKIYFPRIIIPLSFVLGAAVDFFVAYGLLFFLQLYYGVFTFKQFLYVPLIFVGVLTFGLGCAFILSALNSKFRDVAHVIPLLTQLWIFATPIMYPLQIIPERFVWFYSLNPMVGYVEAFRWATTTTVPFPSSICIISSLLGTCAAFCLGVFLFRRWSGTLADML